MLHNDQVCIGLEPVILLSAEVVLDRVVGIRAVVHIWDLGQWGGSDFPVDLSKGS